MLRANEKPPPGQPASLAARNVHHSQPENVRIDDGDRPRPPPPDASQGAVREERRGASQVHPLLRGTHAHYGSAMSPSAMWHHPQSERNAYSRYSSSDTRARRVRVGAGASAARCAVRAMNQASSVRHSKRSGFIMQASITSCALRPFGARCTLRAASPRPPDRFARATHSNTAREAEYDPRWPRARVSS